jgi:hypothetical protein
MFNEYQILLLMKDRERSLARQWRDGVLTHEAKEARRVAAELRREGVLVQFLLRAFAVLLLAILNYDSTIYRYRKG